jgi:hypothetical protein
MGMDIIGRAPTSMTGKYFRNNIHWWQPLAAYCQKVAPEIAGGCCHWHTNDGDGLDAAASRALANALQVEIDGGRCADIAREAEAAPKEPSPICEGGGIARCSRLQPSFEILGEVDFVLLLMGDPDDPMIKNPWDMPCFGCGGAGFVRRSTDPFSVENVQAFVAFLRDCGGFSIW